HPSLEAIQMTEIASINNRVFRTIGSPLILPKHHTCLLKPLQKNSFTIAIDHVTKSYTNVHSIQCRVAKERIRFVHYRRFAFCHRVRELSVTEVDLEELDDSASIIVADYGTTEGDVVSRVVPIIGILLGEISDDGEPSSGFCFMK